MVTRKSTAIAPKQPIADVHRLVTDWWAALNQHPKIPDPGHFPGPIPVFWAKYAATIKKFIAANKILSVDEVALRLKGNRESKVLADSLLHWQSTKGGYPGPHLHYEGKMFPLTEVQWNKFSKSAVADLKLKLEKPGNVTFDKFMTMVEVEEAAPVR